MNNHAIDRRFTHASNEPDTKTPIKIWQMILTVAIVTALALAGMIAVAKFRQHYLSVYPTNQHTFTDALLRMH